MIQLLPKRYTPFPMLPRLQRLGIQAEHKCWGHECKNPQQLKPQEPYVPHPRTKKAIAPKLGVPKQKVVAPKVNTPRISAPIAHTSPEVPLVTEKPFAAALGADKVTRAAAAEMVGKYWGKKGLHYNDEYIEKWNDKLDTLISKFEDSKGRLPTAVEEKQLSMQAAKGLGVYAEAGAKSGLHPEHVGEIGMFLNYWKNDSEKGTKALYQSVVDGKCCSSLEQKSVAFEQAITYEKLKRLYPDGAVPLYRGMVLKTGQVPQKDTIGELATTGAESWSFSHDIAKQFASTGKAKNAVVLHARVPIEYVITSSKTNKEAFSGYESEQEFVVAVPGKKTRFKVL